jgi:predicted short-subunit dehydrogenase-like oxidoreductase (DUF2520 family)
MANYGRAVACVGVAAFTQWRPHVYSAMRLSGLEATMARKAAPWLYEVVLVTVCECVFVGAAVTVRWSPAVVVPHCAYTVVRHEGRFGMQRHDKGVGIGGPREPRS